MLLTILADQYKADESKEIAAALSQVCSPDDNYGWSSAGIYCFWNPTTSEILYIGLSIDLGRRFCEHNSLVKVDPKGTKQEKIKEYFLENEKLGYSVLLQAPLDQPNLSVSEKERLQLPGFEGILNVKNGEGTLLKAYKNKTGKLPPWNKIGGARSGAKSATKGHFNYFKDLSEMSRPSVLRSELSLRQISNSAMEAAVEIGIHGLRIPTIGLSPLPMSVDMAIAFLTKHGCDDEVQLVLNSQRGVRWINQMKKQFDNT